MNPTRLYLIRHGETNLSAEDRFSGGTDVDLSEEGRWQISCLARRLADDNISAFYCSPMRRTIETASIIAESFNLHRKPGRGCAKFITAAGKPRAGPR